MASLPISSETRPPASGISPTRPTPSSTSEINLIYRLMVNRVQPYLTARRGQWFYQNLTLTPQLIDAALNGDIPLGLVSTSGTGTSKWFCLDVDDDVQLFELQTLARQLWDLDCVLFEYSRRGGHLFVFHQQTSWQHSRAIGVQLAKEGGLEGIEVYPKSGEMSAVRLPGTVHPKTGERYPVINPFTGFELDPLGALSVIKPYVLPYWEVEEPKPASSKSNNTDEFSRLVEAIDMLTRVTVYAPNRAKALCPWHEDHHPSLLIKGGRFHCQRPDCVWGDVHDVIRWIDRGIHPPHH